MRKLKGVIITTMFLVSLVVINSVSADATPNHYVSASGSNTPPYDTWAKAAHSIQDAIDAAGDGDTIIVAAGTYIEVGQIFIDKNLSIIGENKITTIIKPAQDTGETINGSDYRAWFYITPGTTFNLSNVTLDGTGWDIRRAIVFGKYGLGGGDGIIHNIIIKNTFTATTTDGVGIATYGNLTISNSTFFNIRRTPIFIVGDSPVGETSVEVSYNTVIGKGDVTDRLDNGIEVRNGAYANIHHNTVSNCRAFDDPWVSVAIYVHHDASADIVYNTIINNTNGITVGYYADPSDTSTVSANFNNITGNTIYGVKNVGTNTVDATYNWWGDNSGPYDPSPGPPDYNPNGKGDAVSDYVMYRPWIIRQEFVNIVAAFIPVKNYHLRQVNTCLGCITENLPEDVPEDVQTLLDEMQEHINNANTTGNSIYANNELLKALKCCEDIQEKLGITCPL